MGSGLPGSLPSYLLYHLLLYISYLANKIVVFIAVSKLQISRFRVKCWLYICTPVERSAVKLSLQSVKNPYYYREHGISTNIGPLKSYLQGESDVQGYLTLKVDVFVYSRQRTCDFCSVQLLSLQIISKYLIQFIWCFMSCCLSWLMGLLRRFR